MMNSRFAKDFQNDETGSMAIELVLVVPILMWVLLSTFVYFDVFRTESNAKRAALTVADMFSREKDLINDTYMQSARNLMRTLTFSDADPDLRVTLYYYDEDVEKYKVSWSRNAGMTPNLTNTELDALQTQGKLPYLPSGFNAILVETRTNYSAPFRIGIGPFTGGTDVDDLTFETFTVMRPRFVPQVCWEVEGGDDLC